MATLSSWTNDGRGLSAARYAYGLRLSAARYAHWPRVGRRCLRPRASRYAHWPWYDVLRSTFWQRKGQPFWLGLVLCPTIGYIDYIYLKTINTKYNKIYILKRRKAFSPYPFSIYILKRT